MAKQRDYKEVYDKLINYQQMVHETNQKRIRVGLKVNILLPLVFLIMSFAISGAKLVFLILWIISLFGIAGYLIYVEYSDYKLMNRMQELGMETEEEVPALIGDGLQQAEVAITERLDQVDEKIEEEKQRIAREIEERKERLKELAQKKERQEEEEDA